MRKTYLIVALLLITLRSHAQQMPLDDYYKPGTTWCEWESKSVVNSPFNDVYIRYEVKGDTLVNGETYHLLYCSTRFILSGKGIERPTMIGGIRAGTDSVFFIRLNILPNESSHYFTGAYNKLPTGLEILLYDYTLNVGDDITWCRYTHKIQSKTPIQLSNGLLGSR